MEIPIKRLTDNAIIPTYAHPGEDAGMDMYAISKEVDEYGNIVYHTGISVAIPKGYVGLVFPRSSNSKYTIFLTNCVGVIDSGYRGEISFKYRPHLFVMSFFNRLRCALGAKHGSYKLIEGRSYEVGDRIGQLIILPYPTVDFIETDCLEGGTSRGKQGYGSTGK